MFIVRHSLMIRFYTKIIVFPGMELMEAKVKKIILLPFPLKKNATSFRIVKSAI